MLASTSGRGYCVRCGPDPIDDVPLVPVTWPADTILAIQSAWLRRGRPPKLETSAAREKRKEKLDRDIRHWNREVRIIESAIETAVSQDEVRRAALRQLSRSGRRRKLEPNVVAMERHKIKNARAGQYSLASLVEEYNADRVEKHRVSERTYYRRVLKGHPDLQRKLKSRPRKPR